MKNSLLELPIPNIRIFAVEEILKWEEKYFWFEIVKWREELWQ